MKKSMKFLLSLCLVVPLLSTSAFADVREPRMESDGGGSSSSSSGDHDGHSPRRILGDAATGGAVGAGLGAAGGGVGISIGTGVGAAVGVGAGCASCHSN